MAKNKINVVVSTQGTSKAKKKLGGVEGGLKSLGKQALIAGAAFFGARAIIGGLKAATRAAAEQELAEKKLEAVLKSTSHAAGMQADELKKLASSLQTSTMYGDEAIMGAESLMLTFTKIGKDVFPDAIETVLNMSTAMGTDMQSSVIQLGKALNDPIAGISALSRVGVQLTDTQKEQIKAFEAAGDTASAQKVILGELETQFGGLAKAAGDTMAGSMAKAKNAMGDVAEAIGDLLAPMIKGGADMLTKFAKDVEAGFDFIGKIDFKTTGENLLSNGKALMKAFTDTVKAYFDFLPDYWNNAISKIYPIMKNVLNGILEAIKGFAGFVWEPIPISAEIMVLRVKRFFVELNVDMTNKMRDAVNNIKDEFNKLVETFPKISEKLGIVKSELAEPIDMTEATASITSQIAGLQSDLEATGMAQFFKKLFPGEGEIQTQAEFAARLKEIWGDYGASIIAINNEVTKSNNEVTENEKDKGAAITVSGEAAGKTALEIKKMSMESAISTGQSAQSVMGAIRDVIKARFASMIAGVLESEIASKGIIGLVTGAAGAAAAMALFESLVPKFAQGGDFVTSGPQMITVGDNPGGMERVQVTPLSSPNIDGPQGSITINISAPLVDETVIDSILPAIEKAQRLNLA
jgi:K+/H+ antiporter YhaU regulatory subunit KhtT